MNKNVCEGCNNPFFKNERYSCKNGHTLCTHCFTFGFYAKDFDDTKVHPKHCLKCLMDVCSSLISMERIKNTNETIDDDIVEISEEEFSKKKCYFVCNFEENNMEDEEFTEIEGDDDIDRKEHFFSSPGIYSLFDKYNIM